jgi:hypothetical protein
MVLLFYTAVLTVIREEAQAMGGVNGFGNGSYRMGVMGGE